jgi:hypothetical protein
MKKDISQEMDSYPPVLIQELLAPPSGILLLPLDDDTVTPRLEC